MQLDETITSQDQQNSGEQQISNQPVEEMLVNDQLASKNKILKWSIVALIVFLLGATAVFAYKYYQTRQQIEKIAETELFGTTPTNTKKLTSIPTLFPRESETISIDGVWNKYISYRLGFSIYIPKETTNNYGACEWSEENGDHSYRPKDAYVPIQTIENNNSVFITGEYFYQLGGETKENNRSYYSECEKKPVALGILKQDQPSYHPGYWEIVFGDAKDDPELEQFIQGQYGSGCKLGDKKTSIQDGVFDVSIDSGEFVDLEEALEGDCLVNYGYIIKYSPSLNKAVSWKTGQDVTFYRGDLYLEDKMKDSFQFLSP